MGSSEKEIAKTIPEASLKQGLAIRGSSVNNVDNLIEKWVKGE